MTAAEMWAEPIRLLVVEYCTISHLTNELYVSRFAVEVSTAISRAAKELGYAVPGSVAIEASEKP